jgi:TPR repeat protein
MYLNGTGVEQSVSRAIGLYDLCGQMNIPRGFNAIGHIYFAGEHRDRDYEARDLYSFTGCLIAPVHIFACGF